MTKKARTLLESGLPPVGLLGKFLFFKATIDVATGDGDSKTGKLLLLFVIA
jgi:hypothetical protein